MGFFLILKLFGIILFLITLPGTLELCLLTFGALFYSKKRGTVENSPKEAPKIAVLIPAHNEEQHLSSTIESLKKCKGNFEIIVIADNCTDATASIAKDLHIRVLEREDPSRLGKPYALQYAFSTLLIEGIEIFVIIDADTVVKNNLIQQIQEAFQNGALAVQSRYTLIEEDIPPFQRLSRLAFSGCNIVRPRGREQWRCSAGILGNGFALSRMVLLTVPFGVDSIVEDAAYHLQIVKAGYRVRFLDDTEVLAVHPPTYSASAAQKSRWEGGRWLLLKESLPWIWREIIKGKKQLIEPLMDLLLLPLSFHSLLLLILFLIPCNFFRLYAALGLGVILLYLFATIKLTNGGWKDIQALCLSPFYLIWKITFMPQILKAAKKNFKWTRTER